jgi:hypothetical protein
MSEIICLLIYNREVDDKALPAPDKGNVPVNVPVNERQQWFLNQLRQGIRRGPADIAAKWDVVVKTAKRDIADLRKKEQKIRNIG